MSICSMTGYATNTNDIAMGTLTIEIKSVNSRFLDLQFRINDDLRHLEPSLRDLVMRQVTRGKVECRLSLGRQTFADGSQVLNDDLLANLARLQTEVRKHFGDAPIMTVSELLRWPGVMQEAQVNQDSLQTDVLNAFATTLDAFVDSRHREGAALNSMLLSRVGAMERIVERITPIVPQVIEQFQQKATARLREALGIAIENNESRTISREEAAERIRQEVTLYGIRIDVAEELTRMAAHLNETRQILGNGGQVGKRLDFMMQELNREANTLGSKAPIKELADASMELKLLIEQMREQVQNLE